MSQHSTGWRAPSHPEILCTIAGIRRGYSLGDTCGKELGKGQAAPLHPFESRRKILGDGAGAVLHAPGTGSHERREPLPGTGSRCRDAGTPDA